jgi:hypothetical protein
MASNVRSAWTIQMVQIAQPARIVPSVQSVPFSRIDRIASIVRSAWTNQIGQIAQPARIFPSVQSVPFVRIDRIASSVKSAWTNQIGQIARPLRIGRSVRTLPRVRTTLFGRIDRRIGRMSLDNPNTNSPVLSQVQWRFISRLPRCCHGCLETGTVVGWGGN